MNQINFSFTNKTKQKIPSGYFLSVLKRFIEEVGLKNNIEINLILTGKSRIQKLNHIHRKKNKPTDVLSFPMDITDPKKLPPTSYKLILGDIYICPQMVDRGELQNTFLHGLIHLIGYDHEKNEKEWEKVVKKFKD